MSEPKVADVVPKIMELEAGTYYWCTCGQSTNQPFCDGSHAGTEFTPMPFELAEAKRCGLCQCKKTEKAPFCDGAHRHIPR